MFRQVTERSWEIDIRDFPLFILQHQKRVVFLLHLPGTLSAFRGRSLLSFHSFNFELLSYSLLSVTVLRSVDCADSQFYNFNLLL